MDGVKIDTVNMAIQDTIDELYSLEDSNCEIKIVILSCSDGCRWITPQPIKLEEWWDPLTAAGKFTFQEACLELNDKLSTSHGIMSSKRQHYPPILFLITCSSTAEDDTDNGETGISVLRNNPWYKFAKKAAIAIGDNANRELCENFTGCCENVHYI